MDLIPEEKGGEIDLEGFSAMRKVHLEGLKLAAKKSVEDKLSRYESPPVLRWRLLEQFGEEVGVGWKGVGI